MTKDPTFLVLEDGTVYAGRGFGSEAPRVETLTPLPPGSVGPDRAAGEVVFNTAMSGYHEVLTDPSYTGQLVTMTYPHMGNYGDLGEWSEVGPEGGAGRPAVKPAGFIVRSVYSGPVPEGRISLNEFLKSNSTPGISEIDTRSLTIRLRAGGSMVGVIVRSDSDSARTLTEAEVSRTVAYLKSFPGMIGRNLIGNVGATGMEVINPDGKIHVALMDCGAKANILRELVAIDCRVSVFPSVADGEAIRAVHPQAFLVSNGPGDPAVLTDQIRTIGEFVGKLPTFGICLGHQLIGHAIGGNTYKMKFGHHGVNHPVRDERTKKVFVTSQNHGFAVEEKSLPAGVDVWFRNANDGSVEGLMDTKRPLACAQFHPESSPGPHDSSWIFREFLNHI